MRTLLPRQRDFLLCLWQRNDYTTLNNWIIRVTGQKSATGGSTYKAIQGEVDGLVRQRLVAKDSHGFIVSIEARVKGDLADYQATGAEISDVTNRALSILQGEGS